MSRSGSGQDVDTEGGFIAAPVDVGASGLVFGDRAFDDAGADPQAPVGLFEYVGITQYLAGLFPIRVDVANHGSLKPLVRPTIERDAIFDF